MAADIDIERSCAKRSRRAPATLGEVRTDSDDRRALKWEASTAAADVSAADEMGDVLTTEERTDRVPVST